MESMPEKYELPGAMVEVHQPFGKEYYYAIADLDGSYPEVGKVAHDIGRREYFHLLDGRAALTINNISHILQPTMYRLVEDGDYYSLEGKARILVFVEDKEGGTTQIENILLNP